MSRRRLAILAAAGLGLLLGGSALYYQCDDAWIAFRYARNAAEGLGFTYNPAPLRPVEGYTSFAWVALLAVLNAVSGVSIPTLAGLLAGVFAWAAIHVLHKSIPDDRVLAVVLLGTVTNRAWLHHIGTGLETPLWTFALLAWTASALRQRWAVFIGLSAVMPLIRPDGVLFLLLTPLFVWGRPLSPAARRSAALLVLPLAHLALRWWTYGALLPNTYAAKVIRPWPLMGGAYAGSFLWEFALWPLLLLIAWGAWKRRPSRDALGITAALGLHTLLLLRWGGDHFEYRILVHWIPLIWWAAATALPLDRRLITGLLTTCAVGWILPWTHYALHADEHYAEGREPANHAVSTVLPTVLYPLYAPWERVQAKLQHHLIGMRHHHLRRFIEAQQAWYAERPELEPGNHVLAISNPGWPGWVLPDVFIIDQLGLVDAVVAHAPPPPPERTRRMAHERIAPEGYVACFTPDLELQLIDDRPQLVRVHTNPITDEQLRRCEARGRSQVGL